MTKLFEEGSASQHGGGESELARQAPTEQQIKYLEDNDELLKKLAVEHKQTWLDKLKKNGRALNAAVVLTVILGAGLIAQSDEAQDVWKWIKLQAAEMAASGPTLSTDPIGVFSRSFIGYTGTLEGISPKKLTELDFVSITRFKLDAVRFKAEFMVNDTQSQWENCQLVVEGNLDGAGGGIDKDGYFTVMKCSGSAPQMLEDYELVAFPPKVNIEWGPATYALMEQKKGETPNAG